MRNLFEQFVRDRRYPKGVSSRTEGWYWQSWKAYASVLQDSAPDRLNKGDILSRIEAMRTQGVSPITVNTYSRAINAFLRWLHEKGHSPVLVQVPRLKEEQKVMATLTGDQIRRLVEYKPKGLNSTRAWTLAMLALDTGLRLNGLHRAAQKCLCRVHVAIPAQEEIDGLACLVDGTIQADPVTAGFHVGLVHPPRSADRCVFRRSRSRFRSDADRHSGVMAITLGAKRRWLVS